jgi:dTDP-4-dehydrorhamnose reductase
MKIMIIGSNGQLGQEFAKLRSGHIFIPLSHEDIEVADKDQVNTIFSEHKPDTVLNLAAFNRVDDCEDEPEKAFQVNALGARNVAIAARAQGSAVVFISTDYVYEGQKDRPRPYLESDPAMPLNVYGVSKLAGEHMTAQGNPDHWIIRTSGLYGVVTSRKGWTFPELILNKARAGESLRVVDDQVLTPTYTRDLAEMIMAVLEHCRPGIYHLTNGGQCSWYEFARAVLEMAGVDAKITPVPSSAFPRKAVRPGYSVLESEKLKPQGLKPMRPWREALQAYLEEKGVTS